MNLLVSGAHGFTGRHLMNMARAQGYAVHALRTNLMQPDELRNEVAHYLVMEADGVICGYGGMWLLFEEAHVTNVAIMPEYRGQGRGKRLMLAMMRHAYKRGAEKMTLEVREGNTVAQHLYATLDFQQNGFRQGYYSDTGEGALILWNEDIEQTIDRERQTNETV